MRGIFFALLVLIGIMALLYGWILIVAPGVVVGAIYIFGVSTIFKFKDNSLWGIFHLMIAASLAIATAWFFFTSTGLYNSYLK